SGTASYDLGFVSFGISYSFLRLLTYKRTVLSATSSEGCFSINQSCNCAAVISGFSRNQNRMISSLSFNIFFLVLLFIFLSLIILGYHFLFRTYFNLNNLCFIYSFFLLYLFFYIYILFILL